MKLKKILNEKILLLFFALFSTVSYGFDIECQTVQKQLTIDNRYKTMLNKNHEIVENFVGKTCLIPKKYPDYDTLDLKLNEMYDFKYNNNRALLFIDDIVLMYSIKLDN